MNMADKQHTPNKYKRNVSNELLAEASLGHSTSAEVVTRNSTFPKTELSRCTWIRSLSPLVNSNTHELRTTIATDEKPSAMKMAIA